MVWKLLRSVGAVAFVAHAVAGVELVIGNEGQYMTLNNPSM